jgi:hypothetical protein
MAARTIDWSKAFVHKGPNAGHGSGSMPRDARRNLQYTSTNDDPCLFAPQSAAVCAVHTFGGRGSPSALLLPSNDR